MASPVSTYEVVELITDVMVRWSLVRPCALMVFVLVGGLFFHGGDSATDTSGVVGP